VWLKDLPGALEGCSRVDISVGGVPNVGVVTAGLTGVTGAPTAAAAAASLHNNLLCLYECFKRLFHSGNFNN